MEKQTSLFSKLSSGSSINWMYGFYLTEPTKSIRIFDYVRDNVDWAASSFIWLRCRNVKDKDLWVLWICWFTCCISRHCYSCDTFDHGCWMLTQALNWEIFTGSWCGAWLKSISPSISVTPFHNGRHGNTRCWRRLEISSEEYGFDIINSHDASDSSYCGLCGCHGLKLVSDNIDWRHVKPLGSFLSVVWNPTDSCFCGIGVHDHSSTSGWQRMVEKVWF